MLTDNYLILERLNPGIGGVQRIYRFPSGYGLSLINSPMAHSWPFAWEAAVLRDVSEDGLSSELTYDTKLTSDVEIFSSDEEANEFIQLAAETLA